MTTKLYQNDVYLKEWDARVASIKAVEGSDKSSEDPERKGNGNIYEIVLDRSAFFPEGGGQSCDIGTIAGLKVIDVQEDGDEVVHRAVASSDEAPDGKDASDAAGPVPGDGDEVHCEIDWDRRFDNMQRHCGEHILSGIFYARCGGVNRGFHMGADYMTIDISLEDDPADPDATRPDQIDMALALDCERRANEVIWSDAPVSVFRFDERDEVGDLPLRKALAFDEDISIVCVGSPENASDCVACCGTHPSSAGQVGLIKIYKVENYKGMFRIYFEAGARALADYDRKHEILTSIANEHSSSIDDVPDALHAQSEKLAAAKNQLYHAKKALIDHQIDTIDGLLDQADDASPIIHRLADLSMDDAFELSKNYMGKTSALLMLYVEKQTSFILVSGGKSHCGNLVREYASFYKGKGGGSDTSARAIFTTEEDAMLFADLVSKHLK